MPLLLIPIIIAAIAFGFFKLYITVAGGYGIAVALVAIVLLIAIALAAIAYFVYRHRLIHGKSTDGQRILSLRGSWGQLSLDAIGKQGALSMNNQNTQFIFADIARVARTNNAGQQALELHLQHASQAQWLIPMAGTKQTRRWEHILKLAAQQKL